MTSCVSGAPVVIVMIIFTTDSHYPDIPCGFWRSWRRRKPDQGDKLKWSRFPESRITLSLSMVRWPGAGVMNCGRQGADALWSLDQSEARTGCWWPIRGRLRVLVWPEAGCGMRGMFPTPAAPPQPTILNISLLSLLHTGPEPSSGNTKVTTDTDSRCRCSSSFLLDLLILTS